MTHVEPTIVALLCNWCAYDGADAAGRARLAIPPQVREVRVACSGQVAPDMILKAFAAGADGVMVLGCRPGDCHYKTGNSHARKRTRLLQAVLAATPVDPRRVVLGWVSAGDGAAYARLTETMVATLRDIGPLPGGPPQPTTENGE